MVGEEVVQDVGQATDRLVCISPEHSPPSLVRQDLLLKPWTGLSLYAFSPFPLLTKTLVKVRVDEAKKVIIRAPTWLMMSLYILLLQMACKIPCFLSLKIDRLLQSLLVKGTLYHTDLMTLWLAAWKLNGRPSRVLDFQWRLSTQHSLEPVQHDSRWRAFTSWCDEQGFNSIHSSVSQVLDFLQ